MKSNYFIFQIMLRVTSVAIGHVCALHAGYAAYKCVAGILMSRHTFPLEALRYIRTFSIPFPVWVAAEQKGGQG